MTFAQSPAHSAQEITRWTALELSRAIRQREVSCVEVMNAYLAHIARFNPQFNALVSLQNSEGLLQQAKDKDQQLAAAQKNGEKVGWMHGFPQAPKDLSNTKGIVTTLGSSIFKNNVPTFDTIMVERIRAAGAILIGKSNTPEFGLGSHTYNQVFGITRNAFNPAKSAGGSSGGAAVALALNLLPVADGSDMMGSLRNPAAWNNVFGFRPSFGRIPSGPKNEIFYQQLGYEGPMARNMPDLAMLLSTQAGFDARAPLSIAQDPNIFAQSLEAHFKGKRIGWLGDFDGYLPMQKGVMPLCQQALKHFETIGCTVDAAKPDYSMPKLWQTWLTLRGFLINGIAGALYADEKLRAQMKPEATWEIENGQKLTAGQIYQASSERSNWYQALNNLFENFDYLVLPSAQVFPFDVELHWPQDIEGQKMDTYHRWMEVVIPATLAGLPVLSVPAGFDADSGLPMGLQIIGKAQADLSVLQVGHGYAQASGYHLRRSEVL